MKDQHTLIKGYPDLSQEEIDLMNEIKEKGVEIEQLVNKVKSYLGKVDSSEHNARAAKHNSLGGSYMLPKDVDPEVAKRFAQAEPHRWAAEAKTDFQKGLMSLVRSIAQPTTF